MVKKSASALNISKVYGNSMYLNSFKLPYMLAKVLNKCSGLEIIFLELLD